MFINQWNKLNFSDFHGHKRIAADIGLVQISATIVLVIEENILNKRKFSLNFIFCSENRTQKFYFLTNWRAQFEKLKEFWGIWFIK
jgi:hypothetical protein